MTYQIPTQQKSSSFLTAIKAAREFEQGVRIPDGQKISISIITNFTDDVITKTLTGLCLESGLAPSVYTVPYMQYHFELKNPKAPFLQHSPDVIYIIFDCNPYKDCEFISQLAHIDEVLSDLERLCQTYKGHIVVQTMLIPSDVQQGLDL